MKDGSLSLDTRSSSAIVGSFLVALSYASPALLLTRYCLTFLTCILVRETLAGWSSGRSNFSGRGDSC